MPQKSIYSEPLKGLKHWLLKHGEQPFRAVQLAEWVYREDVTDFDKMTNLSSELRKKLSSSWQFTRLELLRMQKSNVDGTRKLLFKLCDG